MAYNNPASWDGLNIGDDSFLALFQKSVNHPNSAANPSALVLDPTRFPAPPLDNPTPPASEDSSPSPPSLREKQQFARSRAEEDHSKRKAQDLSDSDDDSDHHPQQKAQHRSDGSQRKSGSRKKGSGGNTDENRVLKRKEQNRAAQRAFRERKEKHVKELEDQVAALENKTKSQDLENENLRDLLGRLQNENLLLKQSAFTFSFPPASSKASALPGASPRAGTDKASPKLPSPSSSSTASSPETLAEPIYSSLFAGPSTASSSGSSSNSPRSEATTSRFHSNEFSLNTLPDGMDVHRDANGKKSFTTIVSNPMYASYQDPVHDPTAWPDYTNLDVDLNMFNIPPYSLNGAVTSMDDLFSGGPSYLDLNNSHHGNGFGLTGLPSPSSALISIGTSPSPVMHRAPSVGAPEPRSPQEEHREETCPKTLEDAQRLINSSAPSTFGPPVIVTSPRPSTPLTSPSTAVRSEVEGKEASAHARMAALCADLPRTMKRPNQIEIGCAWEKVRQHPKFQECDIDELCSELSAKARCDGSRPVLEESSFNDIVLSLPGIFKR